MVKNGERKEGEYWGQITRGRLKFLLAIFSTFFSLLATLYVFHYYMSEDMPSFLGLFVLGLFFLFFWLGLFEWIDSSRRKEGVQGKKKKLLEKSEK